MPGEQRFTSRWALVFTVYQTRMPVDFRWACPNPWTTYQTILTTDGVKSFAIFLYHEMGASNNFCDHAPAGGVNAGDGKRSLMLPMSSTGRYGNFSETLLADSNVGMPGTWMFRVDQENIPTTACTEDGSNLQIYPRFGSLLGGTKVSVSGICVSKESHPNVTCLIGETSVSANVTNDNEFFCVTPIGTLLGAARFAIARDGVNFQYETNFTYDYITTDVILHNEDQLNNGSATTFDISWDQSFLGPDENVTVQIVIWYTNPPLNCTDPMDFVPVWAIQDDPEMVVVSIATARNDDGRVQVPSSKVVSEALPPNSVPVSGFLRVVGTNDANSAAEQDGNLVSPSQMSAVKFLGQIWVNDMVSERAPQSFLQKVKARVTNAVKRGWESFKRAAPCLVQMTSAPAWEAMGEQIHQNVQQQGRSSARLAPLAARAAIKAGCKVYSKFAKYEGYANKLMEAVRCFTDSRGRSQNDLVIRRETAPCPATLAQALRDSGRYSTVRECRMGSTDPSNCIWNKGATHCVLTPMTTQGISSQCCYSSAGNLMDNSNPNLPGGQLQYLPFGIQQTESSPTRMIDFGNYKDSLFAKLYNGATLAATSICCVGAGDLNMCKDLLDHFKPKGSNGYVPPRPAVTSGDPHITTFDNCEYTFNGLGEYSVVSTSDIMHVQGRTKKTDDGRATVWQAVALKGYGRTTVHIQYNELSGLDLFVNNARVDLSEAASTLRYPDLIIQHTSNASAVQVVLNNGAAVEVKRLTKHLDLTIYLPDSAKGLARGLFGSWHGNGSKDLYSPADRVYRCDSSPEALFEFGNQWRVSKAQSLFTYRRGESYEQFNDLHYRPAFEPVPMNATVEQEAKELCGTSKQCFFDYVVTGDRELSADTAQAFHEFDQILLDTAPVVSCGFGRPGENAMIVTEDNSYLEGDIVKFRCTENSIKQSGEEAIICQSDGTWSGAALVCRALASCGPKDAGQNAVIVSQNNNFLEGDTLKFQCTGGTRRKSGQEEIECLSDGTWSGDALTCSACRLFAYLYIWVMLYFVVRRTYD
ncbi:hypothetical protein RvY_08516 [Ramazzottius varieornatus]|uniref:Sushi domain-containing protein n=1 Tax=Ramazzottius varieornatus TaxID=947166 RepID=A0A1D1V8E0_RAMVA|nr:hypothetical protein RvY_08516 [Ramazzottius varieornatus]